MPDHAVHRFTNLNTVNKMYKLKFHKLTFSDDYLEVQIVNREDPSVVVKSQDLRGQQIELIVDQDQDAIDIEVPQTPFSSQFEQSFDLTENFSFQFASLFYSGFGIADIRDINKPYVVYNLTLGKLSFEILGTSFVMRGKIRQDGACPVAPDRFMYQVYRNHLNCD